MFEYFVSWISPGNQYFGQSCHKTDKRIKTGNDVMEMRRIIMAQENMEIIILNFILLDGDR